MNEVQELAAQIADLEDWIVNRAMTVEAVVKAHDRLDILRARRDAHPAPTLPALDAEPGMALAGALEAAHWHLDGEDVDRVIEELTKRGYRLEALRDAV